MVLIKRFVFVLMCVCLFCGMIGCSSSGVKTYGSKTHEAAATGNLDRLKNLAATRNFEVNARNEKSETPLHLAIKKDDADALSMVIFLLNKGADVNARNGDGETPLHLAVKQKNLLPVVVFLLDQGANVSARNEYDLTPLHHAVIQNNSEAVDILLDEGADVNARNSRQETPLHLAAKNPGMENQDIVKNLLSQGADVTATSSPASEPHKSIFEDAFKNDQLWINYFVEVTKKEKTRYAYEWGSTPLHFAAISGNLDAMKILVENGADINARSTIGNTPLHAAYFKADNQEVLEYLIKNGADPGILNEKDENPAEAGIEYLNLIAEVEKLGEDLLYQTRARSAANMQAINYINASIANSMQQLNRSFQSPAPSTYSSSQAASDQSAALRTQQRVQMYRANDKYLPYGDPSYPGIR